LAEKEPETALMYASDFLSKETIEKCAEKK